MHRRLWWFAALTAVALGRATAATPAPSAPLACGDATVVVSPALMRGGELTLETFKVTVERQGKTSVHVYSTVNDILKVRCTSDKVQRPALLIEHVCSGSACAESNFSIIDVVQDAVLLQADQRDSGNQDRAEQILGRPLPALECGTSAVRCVQVEHPR